jgi:isoleucyl-tRNA synthetase
MYQNLADSEDESVHLCDFPSSDPSLVDSDLSAEMNALLRLVSLGSAVRNGVKLKVRQPLATMCVEPGNDYERRAVLRFADQICEELNIKTVTLRKPEQDNLLSFEAKANAKTLGAKLGQAFSEVETALKSMPPQALWEKLQSGQSIEVTCQSALVLLESADIVGRWQAPDGYAGVADGATQILIDIRITEELAQEGMARDIVRHIQELRKKSKLEPEDRIELYLSTESKVLAQAQQIHQPYIGNETLASRWASEPLGDGAHQADVKIEGHTLHIELKTL